MTRHALVVGVAGYHKDRSLGRLPAAYNDVNAVSTILRERGDFTVTVLRDPTRDELVRGLEDLFGGRVAGDSALFYFAGHGVTDGMANRLYLAASDSESARLDSSAMNVETLRQLAAETKASCKVIFLDCCYSGMAGDGLKSRGRRRMSLSHQLQRHGTAILTASDRVSLSFEQENAGSRPALFTEAVVEALSGRATDSDGDGWISIQDVADYVSRSEQLRNQTPMFFANGVTGAIPLTRTIATSGVPETPLVARSIDGVPEPAHPADAPFDDTTWANLIKYYRACLAAEAGVSEWLDSDASSGYREWPGGPEPIFNGSGDPVALPPDVREYVKKPTKGPSVLIYGYPLVLFPDRNGARAEMAPLIWTRLDVDADGITKASTIEINRLICDRLQLEEPEIDDLNRKFAASFRFGNRDVFTEQVHQILKVLELSTPDELDPAALSARVKRTPLAAGCQNVAVVYRRDLSRSATSAVSDDLEAMLGHVPKLADTALGALASRATTEVGGFQTLVTPGPLNESQETIIRSAMTRRLTVATGPPGTGKTALVTALVATAIANNHTILVGSTNNPAVDGVYEKANEIAPGLLIRAGNREISAKEPVVLRDLLATADDDIESSSMLAGSVRNLQRGIDELRSRLDDRVFLEADLTANAKSMNAVREAADADSAFDITSVLDGNDRRLRRVGQRAHRSLRRTPLGFLARLLLRLNVPAITATQRRLIARACEAEQERRELVACWRDLPTEEAVWRQLLSETRSRTDHSRELARAAIGERVTAGTELINDRIANLRSRRSSWVGFRRLLTALPGWAITGHSSRRLPPEPALFDLVVIDEAAQCQVPIVLSLLMRAKRALIIGDPHQIEPVNRLSPAVDDTIRRRHHLGDEWLKDRKLDFTGGTIYHAAAVAAGEVHLLDEHYRCHPSIVDIPNRVVYQGRLAVLTDTARLNVPEDPPAHPAVEVVDVNGKVLAGAQGSCHNPVEATRVVSEVNRIRREYPQASVGVVTPFRLQALKVRAALQEVGIEDVKVGTAHSFQGDECDVIVLSAVGSDGISRTSAEWAVSQTNLWNVAITRAKSRLVVVCDRDWWSLRTGLLPQLIRQSKERRAPVGPVEPIDALQAAFENAGGKVTGRDTLIVGHRCDLIVEVDNRRHAVFVDRRKELTGRAFRQLLATLDLVTAAGYLPVRVPEWRCVSEPDVVARELIRDA